MKQFVFLMMTLLFFQSHLMAQVEEELRGTYTGEIPSYITMINESEVLIQAQEITITLEEHKLVYQLSGSALEGTYEIIDDKRKESTLKGQVSNGRSLNLTVVLRLDKKKKRMYLESDSDQPETELILQEKD